MKPTDAMLHEMVFNGRGVQQVLQNELRKAVDLTGLRISRIGHTINEVEAAIKSLERAIEWNKKIDQAPTR